jgi:FKBP-type peptidyl-prolyl cis-trans isomerase
MENRMFKKTFVLILIVLLTMGVVFAAAPQTLAEKFSYAFGIYLLQQTGENALYYFSAYQQNVYPEMDINFGYMGMMDFSQNRSLYTVAELNSIIAEYKEDFNARMAVKAEENLKKAEDFLKENKSKPGIKTTASGLQYQVITQGTGEVVKDKTGKVELDYELKLLDGTVADSSYKKGTHATFQLTQVIEGFREGIMLMPMGSHYIFYIHPDLGYGPRASGKIEPNSLLIFEVKTYSIVD